MSKIYIQNFSLRSPASMRIDTKKLHMIAVCCAMAIKLINI
jgi:hypothetical protein